MNALSKPTSSTAVMVSLEVVFRLAGKPDDQIRAERKIRNAGAQLADEPEVTLSGVRPAHRLQDARRAGLQGQMGVLAHRRALGHRLDHRAAEVLGCGLVKRMRSIPSIASQALQQLAELRVDLRR